MEEERKKEECQHSWKDHRTGHPLDEIYKLVICTKCGIQNRAEFIH